MLLITASVADAAAVNSNPIRTILASGVSTFFINGKSTFINGPKNLPGNLTNCTILDSSVLIILF